MQGKKRFCLTVEERFKIIRLRRQGIPVRYLKLRFGVSDKTVRDIVRGARNESSGMGS